MNLNQRHIENNSLVTSEIEQAHIKRLWEEYHKEAKAKYIKREHKIFLNHSQEFKEFKDISETEKEKEEIWGEQFN